jgi:hypothetical protein
LHTAIETVESYVPMMVPVKLCTGDERTGVAIERGPFLALLKAEECDVITDLARILRQVSEP